MLISTTSRPVIRVAKLVGTCAPALAPPRLTPASNQRGSPDCQSIWSRRGLCPRHPFTLSRQLVIRKSKYHGGRGSAEQPLALLDSREAPTMPEPCSS